MDVAALRGRIVLVALLLCVMVSCAQRQSAGTLTRSFQTRGIVKEIRANSVVVDHETIPGYMDAMTMPFNVKEMGSMEGVKPGERIAFRLVVTDSESWIDRVVRLPSEKAQEVSEPVQVPIAASTNKHPLRTFKFTNELGQAVALDDFKGTALAITFFFTRCPIPDYCPRLSKNFQQAQAQLISMEDAPTNWHLLSVTIDPEFDKPAVLRSYGKRYDYNPKHWSFLTGPKEKIEELAKLSDVTYEWQGGLLNHNFRTLIIDPSGGLQMTFPIGGDISGAIAGELVKAASRSSSQGQQPEKLAPNR
jgi:protein SCO1/2